MADIRIKINSSTWIYRGVSDVIADHLRRIVDNYHRTNKKVLKHEERIAKLEEKARGKA